MAEGLDSETIAKLLSVNAQFNEGSNDQVINLGREAIKTILSYGVLSSGEDFAAAAIMFELLTRLDVAIAMNPFLSEHASD